MHHDAVQCSAAAPNEVDWDNSLLLSEILALGISGTVLRWSDYLLLRLTHYGCSGLQLNISYKLFAASKLTGYFGFCLLAFPVSVFVMQHAQLFFATASPSLSQPQFSSLLLLHFPRLTFPTNCDLCPPFFHSIISPFRSRVTHVIASNQ